MIKLLLAISVAACLPVDHVAQSLDTETPWTKTTIQAGSGLPGATYKGADGISVVDLDLDGEPDYATTPWEGSSKVSVSTLASGAWTTSVAGTCSHAEESRFADVDGDGLLDILCGGDGKELRILFRNATGPAWTNVLVHAASSSTAQRDMQLRLVEMDGDASTVDVLAGGKRGSTGDAYVRLYTSRTPRTGGLTSWSFINLGSIGWTMSMVPMDVDADGDIDVVLSDKTNYYGIKGARWLEQDPAGVFSNHPIGVQSGDNNFLDLWDYDGDGDIDVVMGAKLDPANTIKTYENAGDWHTWTAHAVAYPVNVGGYVSSAHCDVDGDAVDDLVLGFAAATGSISGVVALLGPDFTTRAEISGEPGEKFDTVECRIVGGVPRVYTTEQNDQLGAIYYARP